LGALLRDGQEFVYASPAYGFAQLALAHACADRGLDASIFVAERKEIAPLTMRAIRAGAEVFTVPAGRMNVVTARARTYAADRGATLLPHGFASPEFHDALVAVARGLDIDPPQVWCAAGSGTLARALGDAWPDAEIVAVQVGHPARAGRARVIVAPERFEQRATDPPPFPSAENYDAKAWRFFRAVAPDGALFWNVGA